MHRLLDNDVSLFIYVCLYTAMGVGWGGFMPLNVFEMARKLVKSPSCYRRFSIPLASVFSATFALVRLVGEMVSLSPHGKCLGTPCLYVLVGESNSTSIHPGHVTRPC